MTAVNKIDGSVVELSFAWEDSPKVLPITPDWHPLEPNSFGTTGGEYKTVSRKPLSRGRQNQKGETVDLDAGIAFNNDLTGDNMRDLLQAFMFADTRPTWGAAQIWAAASSGNHYTSIDTSQNVRPHVGSLLKVSGFSTLANNGLKVVTALGGSFTGSDPIVWAGVDFTVAETLVDETVVSGAAIKVVGHQFPTGLVSLDATAGSFPKLVLLSTENLLGSQTFTVSAVTATGSSVITALDQFAANLGGIEVGNRIDATGTSPNGTPVTAGAGLVIVAGTTTLADLVTYIQGRFNAAEAASVVVSIASGKIKVLNLDPGDNSTALTLTFVPVTTLIESLALQVSAVNATGSSILTALDQFADGGNGVEAGNTISVTGFTPNNTAVTAGTPLTIVGGVTTVNDLINYIQGRYDAAQASGVVVSIVTGKLKNRSVNPSQLSIAMTLTFNQAGGGNDTLTLGTFGTGATDGLTLGTMPAGTPVAASGASFTDLPLIPGQIIFIGGDDAATTFATAEDSGYVRVRAVAATELTLDKTQLEFTTDAGDAKTIQLFFGDVLKNEVNALVKRRTATFRRMLGAPNDSDLTAVQSDYHKGSSANKWTLNLNHSDKATVDLEFVSMDYTTRTADQGPLTGNELALIGGSLLNTSTDVMFSDTHVYDEITPSTVPPSLVGFMMDAKLSINNNISPDKAIGILGAFDTTAGQFDVTMQITAYFTELLALTAIRQNANVTSWTAMFSEQIGIAIDMPLISVGGGRLDIALNQSIKMPLTRNACSGAPIDPALNHTLLITFFDYLPLLAGPQEE